MDKIKSRPTFVLFEKPFHSQYGKGYGNFRFMQTLCKDIIWGINIKVLNKYKF